MKEWACSPKVKDKNSDPEWFLSERTEETKIEKSLRKRRSSDRPKLGFRERPQGLTLLLILWCGYKQGPIMTVQQVTERVRGSYLHPTNGQKVLTPVTELWKSWKMLRRRARLQEDYQSQLIRSPRTLRH